MTTAKLEYKVKTVIAFTLNKKKKKERKGKQKLNDVRRLLFFGVDLVGVFFFSRKRDKLICLYGDHYDWQMISAKEKAKF